MDGLLYKLESRHGEQWDVTYSSVDTAMVDYNADKHAPHAVVVYDGTRVGFIDMNRLSAEISRHAALAGHPRTY